MTVAGSKISSKDCVGYERVAVSGSRELERDGTSTLLVAEITSPTQLPRSPIRKSLQLSIVNFGERMA